MVDTVKPAGYWANTIKPAASKSWEQVKDIVGKDVELGARAKGFARVAGVGVGSYIALGALQSRDADGNERSGLVRIGQAVLGTGIAAGSLIVGHGR